MISVYVGSIVDPGVGAHAILNASNPSVGLGSGVSGAIREACGGTRFQAEVREALDADFGEPLGESDCLVTSGGTSSAFRWVLHVPAVDYGRRDPETGGVSGPTRIASCLRAALQEAAMLAEKRDDGHDFVLAVPLLGAGHGGLGPVVSADVMMEALRQWITARPGSARRVHLRFVVLDRSTARLVDHAAAKHGIPHVTTDASA